MTGPEIPAPDINALYRAALDATMTAEHLRMALRHMAADCHEGASPEALGATLELTARAVGAFLADELTTLERGLARAAETMDRAA